MPYLVWLYLFEPAGRANRIDDWCWHFDRFEIVWLRLVKFTATLGHMRRPEVHPGVVFRISVLYRGG